MNALAKLGRSFRFCTLAGVEGVHIEGEWVIGQWKASLTQVYGKEMGTVLQDFLNCFTSPESILRFTKQHGPLDRSAKPSAEFKFELSEWRKMQESMRSLWTSQSKVAGWEMLPDDGYLAYENRQLIYRARTLLVFLGIDLVTLPLERMRVCVSPDCPAPFFITRHMRQRFCSEECSGWGQRQAKQRWWKKSGPKWRRKRAKTKARKFGGSHGTASFKEKI
jgi:hypothetical protein